MVDLFTELLGRDKALKERGPRKLISIKGPPPPSSETMHPKKEEDRQGCQGISVDKQSAPELILVQKKKRVYREWKQEWEDYKEVV